MKPQQRGWIFLCALLPLLFGGWALFLSRRAPRFGQEWQPQRLGSFYVETQAANPELTIYATKDVVRSSHYIFDLKTNKGRYSVYGNVTGDGAEMWDLVEDAQKTLHLRVAGGKNPFRYEVPAALQKTIRKDIGEQTGADFFQWDDKVGLLANTRLYRWQQRVAKPLSPLKISASGDGIGTINQARNEIIYADVAAITRFSLRDGKIIKRLRPQTSEDVEWVSLSGAGRYVGYGAPLNSHGTSRRLKWQIYRVATEKFVWSFETQDEATSAFFARDGTRHVLAVPARQLWEIRDGATGKILRVLPMLPGTRAGDLSPDGATLYSVANGVLYRQRAR